MAVYKKDPSATLDYTFDWTPYLEALNDTISSVEWITSAGLTIASDDHTNTLAYAFVGGGVNGNEEKLTCKITTVGGRIDARSIAIRIVER